ncbi:MAG: cyanophycinase [Saprospiraceae bacterium]|nr:cyanophycinase [Saprospiraceae bacterium]
MLNQINFALAFALAVILLVPSSVQSQSIGPEQGACFIVGGGRLDSTIIHTFIKEAGGMDSRIIVIPTAMSDDPMQSDPGFKRIRALFSRWGLTNFDVLHAQKEAITKPFIAAVAEADGIWFTGGRQWRLMDAYAETKVMEALQSVLNRGGIIAGTSAGATIQGSYLARGDSRTNTIMMGDHQVGFGLIRDVAIDQHVLARNRQFDLYEILSAHPHLLGIGLDENTGLLIKGNQGEVVGSSYVLIYDGKEWNSQAQDYLPSARGQHTFYMLSDGDRYDLLNRKPVLEE